MSLHSKALEEALLELRKPPEGKWRIVSRRPGPFNWTPWYWLLISPKGNIRAESFSWGIVVGHLQNILYHETRRPASR